MKKIITSILLACMLLTAFATVITVSAASTDTVLTTNKTTYTQGEPILITAKSENASGKDWVGIIPKGVTNGVAIYWAYVKDMTDNYDLTTAEKGGSSVSAYYDLPAGEYTILIIPNDKSIKNGYSEALAMLDVTVTANGGATAEPETPAVLKTDKTTYTVGETVKVTASTANKNGTDWVGIIPKGQIDGVTIYWAYIKDMTENFDIKTGVKGNDTVAAYPDLPAGEYTIVIIENDQYLNKGYATSPAKVDITIVAATEPETTPAPTPVDPPETGDSTLVILVLLAVASFAGIAVARKVRVK